MAVSTEKYSVFAMSDIHIGHRNSMMTPYGLLSADQREQSSVGPHRRALVMQQVEQQVRDNDVVVIDGDFQDRVALGYAPEKSAQPFHSLNMLERWCAKYPEKIFHYVEGNHEAFNRDSYGVALEALVTQYPNLQRHVYGVIVGNILFTHGDLPLVELDISQRVSRSGGWPDIGETPQEQLQAQYAMLRDYLKTSPHAADMVVAVHGGAPVPLTAEMLDNLHVIFGHTHAAGYMMDGAHIIGNIGSLRHDPQYSQPYKNAATPRKLLQPVFQIDGGIMRSMARAFPNVGSWESKAGAGDDTGYDNQLPVAM